MIESGVQTTIDGKTVSKMVETINILADVLGKDEADMLKRSSDNSIINITD